MFLEDGELSYLALAWARHRMLDEGSGPSSLSKSVAALGRFYDFYMLERKGETLAANELHLVLKQFHEARRFGLASLGWDPVNPATAADDVRAVSEFTDWCSDNFGHVPVIMTATVGGETGSLSRRALEFMLLAAPPREL